MELLDEVGRSRDDVRGIGIGVPGPVAFDSGRPVNPPIMPGWDGFPIPDWFASRYDAPVLVDNDVNIMARGEHWTHWRETEHLLLIKVGTGIGCGIVADGHIHRGARGAAGDIGHIRATSARRRRLPLRQHRLPGSRRGRPGARRSDWPPRARTPAHSRDVVAPRPRRPRRRDPNGARRRPHARRGAGGNASTSSTLR